MIEILERTHGAVHRKAKPVHSNVRLLRDLVMVRMDRAEELANGIWRPGSPQRDDEAFYPGTVIACGPGWHDEEGGFHPVNVDPGDRVMVYWLAVQDGKGQGGPSGPLRSGARQAGKAWNGEFIIKESDIAVVLDG
jgi:co-chaperonin GroES (HSP10)